MNKKDISIIIVTFNSQDTIQVCVDSVINTVRNHDFEIIISDNSENNLTQRKIEVLQKEYKNLYYIHNKENLGFSKGNNVAVKKANGRYILFLNPDTEVFENTIDGMIEFMEKTPECGASTCFMELPDKSLDDSSHRGFPTPWNSLSYFSGLSRIFPKSKIFGGYNMTYLDTSKTHEIDALAGSFMLIPFEIGEKVGWWDEDYFFYGEDIDFCYRLKKAGYKIYFVPKFRSLHLKGISSGIKDISKETTKASRETKRWATNHRFSAMEIFYNKHYRHKYPSIISAMVLLGIKLKKRVAESKI